MPDLGDRLIYAKQIQYVELQEDRILVESVFRIRLISLLVRLVISMY